MKRSPPILLMLVTALGLCGGAWAAAEPPALGRLFFSPEARNNLDRQRQLNQRQARTLEGENLRLDGIVVRSSGKSTVWINNRAQTESEIDSGISVAVGARQPERARISPAGEPPADLKVGVTLNRNTREASGGLADGEVRVRRPAPQR